MPQHRPTAHRATRIDRRKYLAVSLATASLATPLIAWAVPASSVELEIATEPGVAPTAAQTWLGVLKDLPLDNFRIRTARGDEQPNIESFEGGRRLQVVGIVTAGGVLVLPGGRFSPNDRRGLAAWLAKTKSGVSSTPGGKDVPFGLTAEQIVTLYQALEVPVPISTKGKSSADVARTIRNLVKIEIAVDRAAGRAFADDDGCRDELEGIACGSALAALIRPLGVVLVPDGAANPVRLRMVLSGSEKSIWPIGWPPEKKPPELVPALLKFIDVEISDTPLADALDAIQPRLNIPFLLDHNGLARQRIDPSTTPVTVKQGKHFYSRILDQITAQAKCKWELRVDEAGKPLAWISPRLG
ncbi:MAG: hypothetical protein U1A77_18110 [Pirellulales bacterium]